MEASETIRLLEARHRLLIGTWAQAMWETDAAGVAVEDSPSWRAYTGQSLKEWLGYGWLDAIHPDDRASAERQWRGAIAARRDVDAEFRLRTPDGGWRWTNVRAVPLLDEDGHIEKWLGLNIDIDDRKRAETALRESEERQAFLLKLADAVRPLPSPSDIQGETTRLLREQLNVGWCYYVDWDVDGKSGVVLGDSASEGLPSLVGVHDVADVPDFLRVLAVGKILTVDDYANYEKLSPRIRRTFTAFGFRSMMVAPLIREGRLIASLIVGDTRVRDWSAGEASLLIEVADRTWAAIERGRAETALQQSEEKFRSVFEVIDQAFVIQEIIRDEAGRAVDMRYVEINPAFTRQTGLGPGIVGKLVSEVMPDVERFFIDFHDRVARTGIPERFENYNRSTQRWYDAHVSAIGGQGRLAASVFEDITERKRAEALVREREERQAFLLKLSDTLRAEPDADAVAHRALQLLADQLQLDRCYIVYYHLEDDEAVFPYQVGNDTVPPLPPKVRLSDFPEAYSQIREHTFVVDDDFERRGLSEAERANSAGLGMRAMLASTIRGGSNNLPLASMMAISSNPRHWSGAEIALVEETAERTWSAIERVRADASLKESEARFQQFAQASASGLWIRDVGSMAMEFISPAIADIYGLEAEAVLGDVKRWAAMIVPDDRDAALDHLRKACEGESTTHEFRIQRPADRAFRWIRDTSFPLLDAEGRVQRIGGIAEDVTRTRQLAEHQDILLHELQHRVRNIMGMIRSVANRTANGSVDVEDYRERLEGRLLALSRVQALLTREANAGGDLRGILVSEIGAQAHHPGQMALIGQDILLSPKAVEVLTLAFHELSTNALKYGALATETGKVTVKWEPVERQGGRWLSVDWSETGGPTREPSTRRGFGSELIEARIPYELGGVGKVVIGTGGAQCHMEFPLTDNESILETDAPMATTVFGGTLDMTGAPDLTGQRVLVVEDDYYMASDAEAALRGAGAEVLGPCSNEEGTRRLLEQATPTAAVLDLNLGGGGPKFEIARLLQQRGVPFIFLTGYDPDVIPDELAHVTRLQKPLPLRDIVEAVRALVD